MIVDEAHRATSGMYDTLLEYAGVLTSNKLFPICGLSATPDRNSVLAKEEISKLVSRFQMNLIYPEFKDNVEYQNNPLEFFKDNGYLSKVNHKVYRSGREYTLTDKEIAELEGKNEYGTVFLKRLGNDIERNQTIIKRLMEIKEGLQH